MTVRDGRGLVRGRCFIPVDNVGRVEGDTTGSIGIKHRHDVAHPTNLAHPLGLQELRGGNLARVACQISQHAGMQLERLQSDGGARPEHLEGQLFVEGRCVLEIKGVGNVALARTLQRSQGEAASLEASCESTNAAGFDPPNRRYGG